MTGGAARASEALEAYMREVRRHPPLDKGAQAELAARFAETRDPELGRALVTANLRLVVRMARKLGFAGPQLPDVLQEGNVGLLQAVDRYDPARGVSLGSYACWWIKAYMLRFALENMRLVRYGTTRAQRQVYYNLERERRRLEARGVAPTVAALAESMGLAERDVADAAARLLAGETSLDQPTNEEDGGSVAVVETMRSHGPLPDEEAEAAQREVALQGDVARFEAGLGERERAILRERLMSDEPASLAELAARYGVSRSRFMHIEVRLLVRLRYHLRAWRRGAPPPTRVVAAGGAPRQNSREFEKRRAA